MQKEDLAVYRDIQKNAEMAMKSIDAISEKVHDPELSRQISRQSMKYSEFRNQALDKIIEAKSEPYRSTYMQDLMLTAGVRSNSMFNTSTSHIAEMMIQGSNRGITQMWKSLNHNRRAEDHSVELAKELMDFEEKNIERLKHYL